MTKLQQDNKIVIKMLNKHENQRMDSRKSLSIESSRKIYQKRTISHQALKKSSGSDNHCTELYVVTCSKCCMKKNIRNNKTDIKKIKNK